MVATLLDLLERNQDEKVRPLQIRYMINAIYATVTAHITEPNNHPVASSDKKSTIRYPLITITRAATSQASVCKQKKQMEIYMISLYTKESELNFDN